jgi:hypothetical protein
MTRRSLKPVKISPSGKTRTRMSWTPVRILPARRRRHAGRERVGQGLSQVSHGDVVVAFMQDGEYLSAVVAQTSVMKTRRTIDVMTGNIFIGRNRIVRVTGPDDEQLELLICPSCLACAFSTYDRNNSYPHLRAAADDPEQDPAPRPTSSRHHAQFGIVADDAQLPDQGLPLRRQRHGVAVRLRTGRGLPYPGAPAR